MAIYRVGYQEELCQATLYNHGCNWTCSICSYKLREGFAPSRFLSTDEVLGCLSSFRLERLLILGGEPLTCADLDVMVSEAKACGAWVKIAHSNASFMPPEGVDEMGISLRAISKRKHQQLTGVSNTKVLGNVYAIRDRGVELEVSTILIPEVVDADEIGKIAEFLAEVDEEIPLHITAFLPVPGITWRGPTDGEMAMAMQAARAHLKNVFGSSLYARDYSAPSAKDTMQHRDGVS